MVEIITPITDTEKIGKNKTEIKDIRDTRQEYEKQWLSNIAFIYGRHHFTIDRRPNLTSDDRVLWELRDMMRKNRTLRVSNYLLTLFRSLLSRMMRMKASITTEATTNNDDDKSAARVAKEILEDFWQNCNRKNPYAVDKFGQGMHNVLYKKALYQLSTGRAYLLPFFNPKTKAKAYLEDQILDEEKIGNVEVKVYSPFNVFEKYDRMSVYCREAMSIDRIEEEFNFRASPIRDESDNVEQRLSLILDGQGEEPREREKSAYVFYKYSIPTKEFPEGQLVTFTEEKLISEEPLPKEYKERIPLFPFDYLNLGFSRFPQSAVEQGIPIQEDLNYTLKRIAEYKKEISGKLLIPRGAKISQKWNDQTGQIIQYNMGFKPTYEQGINPPQFLFNEIERCRRDLEDTLAVHDSSLGKAPSGVKSGVGISYLSELDDSQMAPIVLSDEQQISAFAEMVVEIMQQRYHIRRMIGIAGDNLKSEVNSFVANDLLGNYRVKIVMGSQMPVNVTERRNFILMMLEKQIITPPQARDLLEFGNIEGIFNNIDETQEKEEIQKLKSDEFNVIAEPWEDHTIRLKVLHDFMKTKEYYELSAEIRAKFIEHERQHQEFLSAEAQAAAALTGTVNLPPAPAAQGAT